MSPILVVVGAVALLAFASRKPTPTTVFGCATKIADTVVAHPALLEFVDAFPGGGSVNADVLAQIHACSEAGDLKPCREQLRSAIAQMIDVSTPQELDAAADLAEQHVPKAHLHECLRAIAKRKAGA